MPPAGGQQRAGGRVPQARRPVLAARGEPRAVRAEGEGPDVRRGGRRRPPSACRTSRRTPRAASARRPASGTPAACRPGSRRRGHGPVAVGTSTRQRTWPASSSRSKAVSSTHAATRSPRRVCATLTRPPALGADRHCPGSPPSRSVRRRPAPVKTPTRSRSGAGSRKPTPPAGNGITDELSSSRLCRCRHSQPRRSSGAASSWRAASATSCVCQRRDRGGQAGPVRLVQGRLFLGVRLPRLGVRQVPLLVRFQPFPGHSTPGRRTTRPSRRPSNSATSGRRRHARASRAAAPTGRAATCFPSRKRCRSSASARALG